MFAYLGLKEERRWKIYLSAAFLGLSLDIRLQSILLRAVVVGHDPVPSEGSARTLASTLSCTSDRFALAASPLLVLNTIQFHSPLKTGYDYYLNPMLAKFAVFFLALHSTQCCACFGGNSLCVHISSLP